MASADTLRQRPVALAEKTPDLAAQSPSPSPSPSADATKPPAEDAGAWAWWQDFLTKWIYTGGFITFVHVGTVVGMFVHRSPTRETLWLTYAMFQLAGLGVTMGYHRLFSHKAFEASQPLRVFLMFCGTMALQKSVRWWTIMHRLHHRFVDDLQNDPYAAPKGFYYSHIGWFFEGQEYPKKHLIETDDLDADPLIVFQDKYYEPLALTSSFILPTVIGLFWGDALGALIYAGFLAHVIVWHATWFINSLAHWAGDMPYATSAESTARGHFYLLAMMTNGEGYHNYHHEFPYDYRNGINFWDWDPTKWLIWLCSKVGLAGNLKYASDDDIKAAVTHSRDYAQAAAKGLAITPDIHHYDIPNLSSLPTMSKSSVKSSATTNPSRYLLVVDGLVVDYTWYRDSHPGGARFLDRYRGLDATKAFHGGMNKHTWSARRTMAGLVVGRVEEADGADTSGVAEAA